MCAHIWLLIALKNKLFPEEKYDEDDLFEGEDGLRSLQQLVHDIDSTCDSLTFIRLKTELMYARDLSMTQIPIGGRRPGTIYLMMKLQLASERS